MKINYMIGNTHFDPVWLWTWDEAMASIRATFRSALDRMKETPDFRYSFATPPVFEWIRNTDPELFEEIKERVKEGRWDLCEAWWLQPDCYSASGESYVRQGLYGQKYLFDNFGVRSDCVFNVDSFGHSPQLPQILRKSGVKYYCFVRPETKYLPLEKDCFLWKGIDGTTVYAYRAEDVYSKELEKTLDRSDEKTDQDSIVIYGVTDHGGAPTKKDIALIERRENAVFSTVDHFFLQQHPETTVKGELLTGDFGVFADLPMTKRYNRIAENALMNAEKALVFAGRKDKRITGCWQDVLFNQFHDIMGGSCIREAYEDSRNLYGRAIGTANEILNYAVQSVCRRIDTVGRNPDTVWNLIVWNFNGEDFDGYLESELQWAHEFDWYDKGLALEDETGKRYSCQIIEAKAVIPKFRSRFVTKLDVPAYGYKTYRVIRTNEDDQRKPCGYPLVDNGKFVFVFDEKRGGIAEIRDRDGGVIAKELLRPVFREDPGDTWAFNIEKYGKILPGMKLRKTEIQESGELRTVIRENYRFRDSVIDLYYTIYAGGRYFDLKYVVNSSERAAVFKLESRLSDRVKSGRHRVSVPYGSVERGRTERDVLLGEWLTADGITYLADSAFAYNLCGGKLGITVLRNVIYGDLRLEELKDYDYDILSQGITEGKIRVDLEGKTARNVSAFQNPPHIVIEANHGGTLPPTRSYAGIDSENVAFTVIKDKTDGEGTVLRFVETAGKRTDAKANFFGIDFHVRMKPYEIKTVLVDGKTVKEINLTEGDL